MLGYLIKLLPYSSLSQCSDYCLVQFTDNLTFIFDDLNAHIFSPSVIFAVFSVKSALTFIWQTNVRFSSIC